MIKKFLFLFICVALVATIVGCSLHSGHGHGQANADLSTTLSGTVKDDGTLGEITFPSGAKVSALTADTMQPNVVVTVTESKTSEIGANAIGTPSYIYLYAITAILPTENVRVSSLKQPLSISLPTNHLGTSGVCYVGIRFSEDKPWQYRVVSENGTIALNLRGKASSIPSECNIDLYRPNIQLALFVYDETTETASSTANIVVSEMTATSTTVINIVDGDYQEDLTVKLALEGTNLSGLNASDLTAYVTFRSSNATAMTIKSNGTNVTTTPASDKAVTGANYTHTFKVPSLKFENQLGPTAELSFVINTKKMNASDFPKEFLIELNGVSENVIGDSFVCSEYFAFETASLKENMFSIAYELAGGSLAEGVTNPASYSIESQKITLNNPTKTGYSFVGWTGTGIEEGTASMTVTIPQGSTGDRAYTANWRAMASVMTFTLPGGIKLEMRRCPAGTFVRSGRDGYGDGNTVTITKDFYMGTYEVTNAQYVAIMGGSSPSLNSGENFAGDNQPVVNVSWNVITASDGFIDEMNRQLASQLPSGYMFALPTEAQWEYACRAGTKKDLNSGKDIVNDYALDINTNEVARYQYNWGESNNKTHDVGGLASNSFGLYDMHGNVSEWCSDWYGDYSSTDLTDPTGPAEPDPSYGSDRVIRGGGWDFDPYCCASWWRNNIFPVSSFNDVGFRLALVPGVVGR